MWWTPQPSVVRSGKRLRVKAFALVHWALHHFSCWNAVIRMLQCPLFE